MSLFNWLRRRHSKQGKLETLAPQPVAVRQGFAVVDVETTGFAHLKHRINEIAVVRTDPGGRNAPSRPAMRGA
jgi:DNA polymerase III epsilon subunit-like protein